jgi:glutamate-ammonia-ligase adenylyltransferase
MIPSLQHFKAACPDVDERFTELHLMRLNEAYFRGFSEDELCLHLRSFYGLTPDRPVEVFIDPRKDGLVDCTIVAFDYPSEFSILTGILSGMGFSILSGDIFTYASFPSDYPRPPGAAATEWESLKRRRIVDRFTGSLEPATSLATWQEEFRAKVHEVILLLEQNDPTRIHGARHTVNEMVVRRLVQIHADSLPVLYPVTIDLDNDQAGFTRLRVVSQDTPAFLYALSNALSLHHVLIEHVRIRTIQGRIQDEIHLVDQTGRAILDREIQDRIKLSVLLTKQFTYFLGHAPDPYAALARFETMVEDLMKLPSQGKWVELLANPQTLGDLARLLGASDFLWEDFIRLQYETLLPILEPQVRGRTFSHSTASIPDRLGQVLFGVRSKEERFARLNAFKDREMFLIDLDHILNRDADITILSKKLTVLAEHVVRCAAQIVYEDLSERFGVPRTVGGLEAKYAILGLGKLGGEALGYASDIELLFVYSDHGHTDGETVIENREFFDRLVRGVAQSIEAKREGIFHVDLRLRPYGSSGPLACSLESFCRYYEPGGPALFYERLALVCMRAIGGDPDLGVRLERVRDRMIYTRRCLDLASFRELREKQFQHKTESGKINAKFSAGGLVDLEYGLQVLQIMHGEEDVRLRTPRIQEALQAMADAEVCPVVEAARLSDAYVFLRRLINGLRMLRGSARDLLLPEADSDEFDHLARRMGYVRKGGLESGQRLRLDMEAHMASVRLFVNRYFGPESLPGPRYGVATVADLVLSDALPPDLRNDILSREGFSNPERAFTNLKTLAGKDIRRDAFARLALLAFDLLRTKPDPDMALNNWERFMHSVGSPEFHYNLLLSQPMRLDILMAVFAGSQFLSDTLIRNPGFFEWLMIPDILHRNRRREDLDHELLQAVHGFKGRETWLNKMRRFRRREMLRVGVRDIFLGVTTETVMVELSTLAEALLQAALERAWRDVLDQERDEDRIRSLSQHFCIMAMGKLGGGELNYSSDVDLIAVRENDGRGIRGPEPDGDEPKVVYKRIMERVTSDLISHTEEGYVYRVDLRLRPFGSSGELVCTTKGLSEYYERNASLWEIQAGLKLRPVAGNLRMGYRFLERLRPVLIRSRSPSVIKDSIEGMRLQAVKALSKGLDYGVDVKSGEGGIRDVEFLVQGLQLIYGPERPWLVDGSTLRGLYALQEAHILPERDANRLKEDYLFLRRIEHCLQILEDRQIHALPKEETEITALAKRVMGARGNAEILMEELQGCRKRVRRAYERYLLGHGVTE